MNPKLSEVPLGSVLGHLLFILYIREILAGIETIISLYAYADDSTLLAIFRKPPDRPVVAASLNINTDFYKIQQW